MPNSTQQNAFNGAQSTGVGVIYDALGNARVIGAQMPAGAASGKVLTSDASGNLALAAPTGTVLTRTDVQTSPYTANAYELVPCDTTSGAVTVTLPSAPATGTQIAVKMITQGGTNTVTVACAGSDVFNKTGGVTTGTLTLLNQGMLLQYNPGIWTVLSDDLPLSQIDLRYLALSGGTMSGAIAMGTSKITGLGNGSAAQDAAAFGQTLAGGATLTTLGDILYENSAPAPARLAGNISATTKVLTQTGTGVVSAAPSWAAQSYGGVFGDGSDGSVTFDGTTTVLGLVPSAGVYTMTRDIFCTSITITNAGTLKPTGYRIFCTGTLTNNGTITANGNNAAGSTAGGSSGSGTLAGGRPGGNGSVNNGANGTNSAVGMAAAGAGGAGGTGTAGNGGSSANTGTSIFRVPSGLLTTNVPAIYNANNSSFTGGPGGGGGGGDTTNSGGGGGSGGGPVIIFAPAVNNGSGTITAIGGNGANGAAGNAGGGGGGTGGLVVAYTLTAWTSGTVTLTGGTKGTKTGTGADGTNGAAGTSLNVVLA